MKLDNVIAALADPTRRRLLRRLGEEPRRASELASGFAISRPAICKHTHVLARAGLIRAKKNGRERIYELAPGGREAIGRLIVELTTVQDFWDSALKAFKQYVEEQP
ncbi:MAG TPA: metalloregulator ArsR/SmtB family transcription factor [Candidatus Binataceae bacterium]|nr:metalloregulator ArsR/SmtB family transcription factor [Candidatus Binataceae bacterium]